jgi:Protein of unknown function (DUF2510)
METALAQRPTGLRGKSRSTKREARDLTRPGWFPDPAAVTTERFWTGTGWTGLIRPIADTYALPVAGVARTMFDQTIARTGLRSRRLAVTDESIRWGRFNIALNDITTVTHWVKCNPKDGRWERLVFVVEGRLGTLRVDIHGVKSEIDRARAYDGYRALVSVASSIVIPRLAVDVVDRLESGQIVKLADYRMSARGVSQKHREGGRHPISGRWSSLQLNVDPSGQSLMRAVDPTTRGAVLLRTEEGLPFPAIDLGDRAAAILPLVLCLAKDRFINVEELRAHD